ncbi:MAG: PEP-CTERM sorting domain-containing protein [Deltaproteobacteria bacterium]|nr:PEP-CTERM sorting domain-containing protein [Deltaproteobacteria bacterium]
MSQAALIFNGFRFKDGSDAAAHVPEPATTLLFGSGLVSTAGLRRKFRKS